jgi:hypothetical protein
MLLISFSMVFNSPPLCSLDSENEEPWKRRFYPKGSARRNRNVKSRSIAGGRAFCYKVPVFRKRFARTEQAFKFCRVDAGYKDHLFFDFNL